MNRSIIASVLVLAALSLLMQGCKYPEGPFVSLQSPDARIANSWEVNQAFDKDGTETSDFNELEFTFTEEGAAEANIPTLIGTFEYEGTWDLDNDETVFDLNLQDEITGLVSYNREYDILRLTADEFWLFDKQDSIEIRLETK